MSVNCRNTSIYNKIDIMLINNIYYIGTVYCAVQRTNDYN